MRLLRAIALISALLVGPPAQGQISTVAKSIEQLGDRTSTLSARDLAREVNRLKRADQDLLIRAIRIDPRIVGGDPADIANFPYQVALIRGYAAEPYRSQFCGGSIIGQDVVLTAAHCIDSTIVRRDPTRVDVVAGSTVFKSGGERISVEAVFIHPQWDAKTNDFDFAILKLKKAFAIGKPVSIEQTPPAVGDMLSVSGWGAVSEGGAGSDDLLAAEVPLVDNATCASTGYGDSITPRMMCAGLRDGGVDSCQGDSGGPLVAGATGARRLVGVVSWGEGCARKLRYGVYARVTEALPWIRSLSAIQIASKTADAPGQLASTAQ